MKLLFLTPLAFAGLTGCAVYTPYGHYPAQVRVAPSIYVHPAPVYVQPGVVHARPSYRGRHRRDLDRDGVRNRQDRDRDGAPNRYDRQPDNPWRR